jgi:hypothetical protein
LRGGDTVYVDTGDYTTNVTTTIGRLDSGWAGNPVRIIGSPKGSFFNRGSTTADTLELNAASHLELEHLRLTGGRYGLFANVSSNIVLRDMQFTNNQHGVYVTGAGHLFERCLAAGNAQRGYFGINPGKTAG